MHKKILHKTYGIKTTLWLSEDLLLEKTAVQGKYLRFARSQYRKSALESGKLKDDSLMPDLTKRSWRWRKIGKVFYYDYEYIPNHSPNYYQEQLGTRHELIEQSRDLQANEPFLTNRNIHRLDKEVEDYKRTLEGYEEVSKTEGIEQTLRHLQTVAFIDVVLHTISCKGHILYGYDKVEEFLTLALDYKKQKGLEGLNVSSTTALRNKLKGYKACKDCRAKLYYVMRHGNRGNSHALKMLPIQQDVMTYLRSLGANWSDRAIYRKVRDLSIRNGWIEVSERLVEQFLNSPQVQYMTERGRYGVRGRYLSRTNGTLPIAHPIFAGDCWQADATRVNLIAHKTTDGKAKFLFITAIRDLYSGAVLGWSYGYSEDHSTYINALRMAVENTGYLPYELVHDKFPGHNTEQWKWVKHQLERLGVKLTITSQATGKAQIERMFGTLQSVFMSESQWYYGEGIKSNRRYAHRSEEYLQKATKLAKQENWNYDKACDETDGILERYNKTPLKLYSKKPIEHSPLELHEHSEKRHAITIDAWLQSWIFGYHKTLRIQGGGLLKTSIQQWELCFRIEQMDVIKHYKKVELVYDLRHLDKASIFHVDGKYLGEVERVEDIQIYGPMAELGRLSEQQAKNKRVKKDADQDIDKVKERIAEELGDEMALLQPMSLSKYDYEQVESQYLLSESKPQQEEKQQDNTLHHVGSKTEQDIYNQMGNITNL